jgi:SAM-dependent methyltransferase
MDMHALLFPADSFDAVYSSHSLEHSYDPDKVVREIVRVARNGALIAVEVPVSGQASAADRIVFSGLDELRETFRPYIREELWAEEQPARTSTNGQDCEIARIAKSPALCSGCAKKPRRGPRSANLRRGQTIERPRSPGGECYDRLRGEFVLVEQSRSRRLRRSSGSC